MVTLEQRIKFATEHVRDKEGRPFRVDGGFSWVIDEFWKPATGFKLWPNDIHATCPECQAKAGEIVEWTHGDVEEHGLCAGLKRVPITMVVMNLPRRGGKTFGTAGFVQSTLFMSQNESITFVASSEDQTGQLFHENYRLPIMQNPRLAKNCRLVGNQIKVPKTRSFFECVTTSHGSITGRGRTYVILDEARDIPARTAMSLLPSTWSAQGKQCPNGHVRFETGKSDLSHCNVCAAELEPWFGRVIITSSSGLLEGSGEKDWFAELVQQLEESPDQAAHLYRADRTSNPYVAAGTRSTFERIFGSLESTKVYTDIEVYNRPRRKGEDFLTTAQIRNCVNPHATNVEGSANTCVAFLDTSITQDLTNLVIVEEDTDRCEHPWQHVRVCRIDIWSPKKRKSGVIDENEIQAHLDRYIPLFPNMRRLLVDVRAMAWAVSLVDRCRKERPGWGRKVESFHGQRKERDLAWGLLEQRFLDGTIVIPDNKVLIEELMSVRRVLRPDGTFEVRDRDRKKRHADVAESLAACTWMIFVEQSQPRVNMRDILNAPAFRQLNARKRPRKLNPSSF